MISGAGDLGMRVARRLIQGKLWRNLDPSQVLCETMTEEKHTVLRSFGFECKLSISPSVECDSLLISFPPSGRYKEEVERALKQWNGKGPALLISSSGVYQENEGNEISENAALKNDSTKAAEDLALAHGAHVVRLAGLYSRESGPQVHWQKIREVNVSPSVFINLIHRHDAADALARLLVSKHKADVWNLSDNHPLRRFDVDQIWSKHLKVAAAKFLDLEDPGLGKKVKADKICHALDWQPRWRSFQDFVGSLEKPRNVLGSPLKNCCLQPVTGFQRDGFCKNHDEDRGKHILCAEMTEAFLKYSKESGNDLSTPRPEVHFVGLKAGDKWCLCASRWLQALEAGAAPRIYIECTHESMIEWVEPEILRAYAVDLS
jgi:uncharacterized protein (DUF2237 family)